MNAVSQEDVQHELTELEVEEARIMRELEEMDEKQHSAAMMARGRVVAAHSDPGAALNALLLDCEKEVRDAKGYIASAGPPLQIARCKPGETVPKHGTFLSRPKGTGVDFTVPVTLKDYYDTIKTPIFLNTYFYHVDRVRKTLRANNGIMPEDDPADHDYIADGIFADDHDDDEGLAAVNASPAPGDKATGNGKAEDGKIKVEARDKATDGRDWEEEIDAIFDDKTDA